MNIYLEESLILQHFTPHDKKEQIIDSFAQFAVPSQTIFCICCVLFVLIFTFEYGNHLIWVILHGLTRQAKCITLPLHENQLLSTNGKSEHCYQKRLKCFHYEINSLKIRYIWISNMQSACFLVDNHNIRQQCFPPEIGISMYAWKKAQIAFFHFCISGICAI